MKTNKEYLAPEVQELMIAVEKGFVNSIEDPDEKPEIDW